MKLPVFVDSRYHDAVIFDVEGVVADTAALHTAAWKATLNDFLARRAAVGAPPAVFTDADYHKYLGHRSEAAGVTEFLVAQGISLPAGRPGDHVEGTVWALVDRTAQLCADMLADGVRVFESTVEFVHQLQAAGIATAVFASRCDCARILDAAGLSDLFAVRVDGPATRETLAGAPTRTGTLQRILHDAADRLAVSPRRCVVIDDTAAGVTAGRDGGFGLVIGVDRDGDADELSRCGADVVVGDLVALTVRDSHQRVSDLPDALESYTDIAPLAETRRPVVLLDFDGTVSDIVADPNAATLLPGADQTLAQLAAHCPVAVVSGRSLADIRQRIGVPGLWYAGSHGFELVSPDGAHHQNEAGLQAVDLLQSAVAALHERLDGIDGVLIEDKRFSVAVHYRNVDADRVDEVIATVRIIGQRDGLRVTGGRKVVELRPDVDWDKGRTVNWILAQIDGADLQLPIYLGDDLTDEDAFDAIRQKGVGIAVRSVESGDRRTAARFALEDPDAVCRFLTRVADQLASAQDSTNDPWTLIFGGYQRDDERLREALCTMGNGYMAVRGAAPECAAGEFHYPATYVAGVYNRLTDEIAGVTIDNESLVNLPNWLPVQFRIDGGPWFDIDSADISAYRATVDLRRATFTREFVWRDPQGRTTLVTQRRLVAMHQPHVAALETTLQAQNWAGRLEMRSTVDGDVTNSGVERYRQLASRHLRILDVRTLSDDAVALAAETVESKIQIAIAVRHAVRHAVRGAAAPAMQITPGVEDSHAGHHVVADLGQGAAVTLEKVATVFTSRDHAISGPAVAAERELRRTGDFAEIERGHRLAWAHLWERFTIDMGHDPDLVRLIRLHQLHLLNTVSPHTADLDVGVPARGLHGEAYRGHVFWDELFVFPVTNLRLPKVTRALLMYRFRRLPEARRAAAEAGYAGAMYPWQSGSDGREESQRLHLNPRSGRWNPDASARAHHIGLAIAFNVWQHYQVTGDIGFLIDYGAEMLADIARFWVSLAEFDTSRDRYVIKGVIGPDEFHSGYPGRDYDGVDNNAYTNVMAVWVIVRALEALDRMPMYYRLALLESLGVDDEELVRWEDVSRRMYVPFHDGVISQFEGYADLEELDWDGYRARYDNLQRLDRILEAEGDSVNKYRAAKQADVLMLFYLLSADELYELFDRLGYRFTPEQIPKTIDYYHQRTSHGSTLSNVVHAWVMARGNRHQAMEYFAQALASDIVDIQRGTTAEGIHLAAMAGSIDLLQRCFTGLEIRSDRIVVGPLWPKSLGPLEFTFRYRGHRLRLRVAGRGATLRAEPGDAAPVTVECRGETQVLNAGASVAFSGGGQHP